MCLLHAEELRAGGGHAQSGRIGRPDAGHKRLDEAVEGLAAEPAEGERLEGFVSRFPRSERLGRDVPLGEEP